MNEWLPKWLKPHKYSVSEGRPNVFLTIHRISKSLWRSRYHGRTMTFQTALRLAAHPDTLGSSPIISAPFSFLFPFLLPLPSRETVVQYPLSVGCWMMMIVSGFFLFSFCCLVAGFNWQELGKKRLGNLPAVFASGIERQVSPGHFWHACSAWSLKAHDLFFFFHQWAQAPAWDWEVRKLLQYISLWRCLQYCRSESLTFVFEKICNNEVMNYLSMMVCPQPRPTLLGRLAGTHSSAHIELCMCIMKCCLVWTGWRYRCVL